MANFYSKLNRNSTYDSETTMQMIPPFPFSSVLFLVCRLQASFVLLPETNDYSGYSKKGTPNKGFFPYLSQYCENVKLGNF